MRACVHIPRGSTQKPHFHCRGCKMWSLSCCDQECSSGWKGARFHRQLSKILVPVAKLHVSVTAALKPALSVLTSLLFIYFCVWVCFFFFKKLGTLGPHESYLTRGHVWHRRFLEFDPNDNKITPPETSTTVKRLSGAPPGGGFILRRVLAYYFMSTLCQFPVWNTRNFIQKNPEYSSEGPPSGFWAL